MGILRLFSLLKKDSPPWRYESVRYTNTALLSFSFILHQTAKKSILFLNEAIYALYCIDICIIMCLKRKSVSEPFVVTDGEVFEKTMLKKWRLS